MVEQDLSPSVQRIKGVRSEEGFDDGYGGPFRRSRYRQPDAVVEHGMNGLPVALVLTHHASGNISQLSPERLAHLTYLATGGATGELDQDNTEDIVA